MAQELAHPDDLWAWFAASAIVDAATGYSEFSPADEHAIAHDSGDGTWLKLRRLGNDRAVLFGVDRDRDPDDDPEDLLAGAPDWVVRDELVPPGSGDDPQTIRWHDGREWSGTHPSFPGLTAPLSSGEIASMLHETAFERGLWRDDVDREQVGERVEAAVPRFVAAAEARRLGEAEVVALLSHLRDLDVDAGVVVAGRTGLTANVERFERGQALDAEIARTDELPGRPVPPAGAAEAALVAWMTERAAGDDGRCVFRTAMGGARVRWDTPEDPPVRLPGESPETFREQQSKLITALWRADNAVTGGWGGWLYLRVEVNRGHHEIARCYDHQPPWGVPIGWGALLAEMERRDAPARPPWADLDVLRELAGA